MLSDKERYERIYEFEKMTQMKTFKERVENPDYRFVWALERLKEGNVLDVGAGDGVFVKLCQNKGMECDAVEIAANVREDLKKNCGDIGIFMEIKDVPSESYDNVVCLEVLEHVMNPNEFFKELFRALKKKGKLLLTVPLGNVASLRDPTHRTIFEFYDLFNLALSQTEDFKIYLINKFKMKNPELNLYALEAVKH